MEIAVLPVHEASQITLLPRFDEMERSDQTALAAIPVKGDCVSGRYCVYSRELTRSDYAAVRLPITKISCRSSCPAHRREFDARWPLQGHQQRGHEAGVVPAASARCLRHGLHDIPEPDAGTQRACRACWSHSGWNEIHLYIRQRAERCGASRRIPDSSPRATPPGPRKLNFDHPISLESAG